MEVEQQLRVLNFFDRAQKIYKARYDLLFFEELNLALIQSILRYQHTWNKLGHLAINGQKI